MTTETRILLVDDDAQLRAIFSELLEAAGYRVSVADSSMTALAAVEHLVPDVALIDCAMPSINGAGLARMLNLLQPQLPVIFITGYADTDALRPALGSDATVLRKPLLLEDVVGAVETVLGRSA